MFADAATLLEWAWQTGKFKTKMNTKNITEKAESPAQPENSANGKVQMPWIQTYGNYSSNNYGAHALQVRVGNVTVWFSYQTPVAFKVGCNPIEGDKI